MTKNIIMIMMAGTLSMLGSQYSGAQELASGDQNQDEADDAEIENVIVVLGKKLSQSRFIIKIDNKTGELKKCKMKKSSGDKALDEITCKSVQNCIELIAIDMDRFGSCVNAERKRMIYDLAKDRVDTDD